MILVIDNYDSFTYNLVDYLAVIQPELVVWRSDQFKLSQVHELNPSHIVISPGPGSPQDSGLSKAVIREFQTQIPILGVCLGHQCLAEVFGAKVVPAAEIMHGKTSLISHCQQGIFANLPQPLRVMRYHSLAVEPSSLPQELQLSAWTTAADGSIAEVMAISHRSLPIFGVQFHPESILSENGRQLLMNFLHLSSIPQQFQRESIASAKSNVLT